MIDEQTMRSWLRRVDEEGEGALIRVSEPVNKFPDIVRYLVKQLRMLLPTMGKTRIAQVLARAGLHLGVTTVGRILKETELIFEPRRNWPATGLCASPQTTIRGERGVRLSLAVGYVEDRRHLPVVELRKAA